MSKNEKKKISRAMNWISAESFCRAINVWHYERTFNGYSVSKLDTICNKFGVSFEDAIAVALILAGKRKELQRKGVVGYAAEPCSGWDQWPSSAQIMAVAEAERRLWQYQAEEQAKTGWWQCTALWRYLAAMGRGCGAVSRWCDAHFGEIVAIAGVVAMLVSNVALLWLLFTREI